MRRLSELQKSYLAGFIDGEGCITISKKKDHSGMRFGYCFRPHVNVANSNEASLNRLVQWTGLGNVSHSSQSHRKNRKDKFQWQLWSQQARQVIEAVLPFLYIKKQQAVILLKFISNSRRSPGSVGLSNAEWKRQHQLNAAIKRLNKRGKP